MSMRRKSFGARITPRLRGANHALSMSKSLRIVVVNRARDASDFLKDSCGPGWSDRILCQR